MGTETGRKDGKVLSRHEKNRQEGQSRISGGVITLGGGEQVFR